MLLNESTIRYILKAAYHLLWSPGVRVQHAEALDLLGANGAVINAAREVAHIPAELTRLALSTAPPTFALYDTEGAPAAQYGGGGVHFTPGSAAVAILDPGAPTARPPHTQDLARATRLAGALPAIDAASTCLVCTDVPAAISDVYRLRVVLRHTDKPVVTGAFSAETWQAMYTMLVAASGDENALAAKPRAIFDVCPRAPLTWDPAPTQNMLDCARHRVPAQIVPAPEAGVTAPVTLSGALVQYTAETLSGIVIHQLAAPGAPVVWGGLPTVFDPHTAQPATGRIETAMLNSAGAEIGAYLGLPTYAYLGLSDASHAGMQAGAESAMGILWGTMTNVDMIAGPGMLGAARVFSLEKLAFDAEVAWQVRGALRSVPYDTLPEALEVIRQVGHTGSFLTHPHTARHFREVLNLDTPSPNPYSPPEDVAREIDAVTLGAARQHGMDKLPDDTVS